MPLDLETLSKDLNNLVRRFDIFEAQQQMRDQRTDEWREEFKAEIRENARYQRLRSSGNGNGDKGGSNAMVVAVATAAAAAVVAAYKFLGGP